MTVLPLILAFATGAPTTSVSTGSMVFVDDVQVRSIGESGEVSGGTLNLSSGAEIVLDRDLAELQHDWSSMK